MGLPASDLLIPIEIDNVRKIFLGNKMLKTKLEVFLVQNNSQHFIIMNG
jgi:hypothetical protein